MDWSFSLNATLFLLITLYECIISLKIEIHLNNNYKFISYRTKIHCTFIINTNCTELIGEIIAVYPEKHLKRKVRSVGRMA
jgi:hypothetical protein